MNIFIICPVRHQTEAQRRAIAARVAAMERYHQVYWPYRDTAQNDPAGGVRIVHEQLQRLAEADWVAIYYVADSAGSKFDLGAALALHKPLLLLNPEEARPVPYKDHINVIWGVIEGRIPGQRGMLWPQWRAVYCKGG